MQKSKGVVHVGTLDCLGIDVALYDKSTKAINESPEMQQRAKETMARIEVAERSRLMGEGYTPMTREVTIERIKKIEDKKSEFVAGIMVLA